MLTILAKDFCCFLFVFGFFLNDFVFRLYLISLFFPLLLLCVSCDYGYVL